MIRNIHRRVLSLAASMLCVLMCAVPVFAAEAPGEAASGSISVTIHAYASDDAVGGGSLNLYKIADVAEPENALVYTDPFSGLDEVLLGDGTLQLAETAGTFAGWADKADIPADAVAYVDATGQTYFGDLTLGLYMVTQNEPAEGYDAVNPFLVTIPIEEDGAYVYDVDATPKTSPVTAEEPPTTEEPPTAEEPPTTENPPTTDNGGGSGTGRTGTTKTGDTTPVIGVAVIGAAAAAAAIVAVRQRRKSTVRRSR